MALLASLLTPASASAHGIVGRADLPIPAWLFAWTATAMMVVSFVALWSLWSKPRLQRPPGRVLLRVPKLVEWLCGGDRDRAVRDRRLRGAGRRTEPHLEPRPDLRLRGLLGRDPDRERIPGRHLPALQSLARARATRGWLLAKSGRRRDPLLGSYPPAWGRWPAAAMLLAFAWVELVLPLPGKDNPRLLAILMLIYGAVQLAGMAAYGVEAWCERADGFGVYFGLMARLAPLSWRDRELRLRVPLSGLVDLEPWPGTAAVLFVLIGSTTFDGFSNGELWVRYAPSLQSDLGLGSTASLEIVGTVGLLLCIAVVAGLYNLGIYGMRSALRDITAEDHRALSLAFLYSLVPIAFGYMLAHYFSLLILQGQAIGYLVSDPLGRGSDLFGTASYPRQLQPGLLRRHLVRADRRDRRRTRRRPDPLPRARPDRVQVPRSGRPLAVLDARDHGRLHLPGAVDPLRGHHHHGIGRAQARARDELGHWRVGQ